MDTKTATVEPTIAPAEEVTPTLTVEEDLGARFQQLEKEKDNYKTAYLNEFQKNKALKENQGGTLTDEDKMRQIAEETLANSRVVEIAREQDEIIQKALKENKELKLAHLNKTTTTPAATVGAHSETAAVKDTSLSPELLAYGKARNWSDKDFANYKKNLARKG